MASSNLFMEAIDDKEDWQKLQREAMLDLIAGRVAQATEKLERIKANETKQNELREMMETFEISLPRANS